MRTLNWILGVVLAVSTSACVLTRTHERQEPQKESPPAMAKAEMPPQPQQQPPKQQAQAQPQPQAAQPQAKAPEQPSDQLKTSAAAPQRDENLPPVEQLISQTGDQIRFDTGSAELDAKEKEKLAQVGEALSKNPDQKLRISGFTDNKGSPSTNQRLSKERAQSVAQILSEHGAKSNQLEAVGRGSKRPVASNKTETGRAKNRRVELELKGSGTSG